MTRLLCLAVLAIPLTACVDPRLGAGISIGSNSVSIAPVISGGVPGGGTISYTP